MSQTQSTPEVSGNMFLFERPELLNKEQHGAMGLTPIDTPYEFCAKVRAIPLTITEIPSASKHYPVVFMSQEDPVPLAIVGLFDDVNLFVDETGAWQKGAYIPGYLRRYPFALASETGGDRFAIVIDTGHKGVSSSPEVKFFNDNGESSDATKQALEFCKSYETDRLRTMEIMKVLMENDLVQGQSAQYTPTGQTEPQSFAGYFGIDEQRLNNADDATFLDLRKRGVLPILYAQLMSLSNWRTLLQMRADRFNLTEDQIMQQVPIN